MKPEQQRIAIAEARGFTDIMGDMGFHQKMSDDKAKECGGTWRFKIPDYLNDLNAMHEAVDQFKDQDYFSDLFGGYLVSIVKGCLGKAYTPSRADWIASQNATASQRAEAFLRAIGKWTGGDRE